MSLSPYQNSKGQRLGFRHPANGKRSGHLQGGGTGLHNPVGVKRDQRILIDIKEVFTLQLAVLHATSGVHAFSLNLDV